MFKLMGRAVNALFNTLLLVRVGTTAGFVVGFGLLFAVGLPIAAQARARYGAHADEFVPLLITGLDVLVVWFVAAMLVQWFWLLCRNIRQTS